MTLDIGNHLNAAANTTDAARLFDEAVRAASMTVQNAPA